MNARIAIVEDEDSLRFVLEKAFGAAGAEVQSFEAAEPALAAIRSGDFDLVITDIRLPDRSGLELLSACRELGSTTPFLVMTAESTMANAIEAMKRGAFDYVTKPFDIDALQLLAERAIEMGRLSRRVQSLSDEVRPRYEAGAGLVGSTATMQDIYKTVGRAAASDATVLITGESGTGKELIARAVHFHSGRSGAFIAVNCAAIPAELLESELFGHERGAFTGANERRSGRFENAVHGTIFFDEIGEMTPELQTKLLRVLQEREYTRVGGSESLQTDARVLAATHRDLERAVRDGSFREDLFFRLNVIPIRVPPLRERRSDIRLLIQHFLGKIEAETGVGVAGITPEAEELLSRRDWPGNVRELENSLLRAAVMVGGRALTEHDFDERDARPAGSKPSADLDDLLRTHVEGIFADHGDMLPTDLYEKLLTRLERPLIEVTLEKTGGNQIRAAEILGINRNTLRKKITTLGITLTR